MKTKGVVIENLAKYLVQNPKLTVREIQNALKLRVDINYVGNNGETIISSTARTNENLVVIQGTILLIIINSINLLMYSLQSYLSLEWMYTK